MLLVCFLLATVLNATEPANETVHFESDINVALQKAQKSAKSQIIIFSAKWCLPCAEMKENTVSDQDLIKYMNENAVNSLVDIDSETGFLLKLQYNITMLPTIILLSSLVGAVVGIGLIVFARRGRDKPIPFGPYLAAAGLIALLYGAPLSRLIPGLSG